MRVRTDDGLSTPLRSINLEGTEQLSPLFEDEQVTGTVDPFIDSEVNR